MNNLTFNKVGGKKQYFKYKECEEGQILVTGKYLGTSPNKFGNDNHDFKPLDGGPTVCLNSAGHLNYQIEEYVGIGSTVQVVYLGQEELESGAFKGKMSHQFEILLAEQGELDAPTKTEAESIKEVQDAMEEEAVEAAPVKKKVAKKKVTKKAPAKKKPTIDLSDLD